MTNPDKVERLRELLGKATEGPWARQSGCARQVICGPNRRSVARAHLDRLHGIDEDQAKTNAALIVEAINALPALLAVVEALEEVRGMAHSHVSCYNRNGPEWTSDQGTELYSASFVVESHTEIADVAQAALDALKGEG